VISFINPALHLVQIAIEGRLDKLSAISIVPHYSINIKQKEEKPGQTERE
jgi:hypothetical protein